MDTVRKSGSVHHSQQPTAATASAAASRGRTTKVRRTTRACDFCNRRSIKCKKSEENSSWCQNCVDFDTPCTYDRPAKRRGKKIHNAERDTLPTQSEASPNRLSPPRHEKIHLDRSPDDSPYHESLNTNRRVEADEIVGFSLAKKFRDLVVGNRDKIANLVNVYFEVVYPIFPLFHKGTLLRKVADGQYLKDPRLFSTTMSICALASARARDGALPPGRWDPAYFASPAAEIFYTAAKDTMPSELAALRGIDYMRTCALLALLGVQLGKVEVMHQYLGLYHSLVALDGLHDEKNWPDGIGRIETELRRRLYWSLYTFEVYYSIVWGGVIRLRESQSRVSFPTEIDDEYLTEENAAIPPYCAQPFSDTIRHRSCWMHGWNFTTEMYRILEHANDGLHRRREQTVGPFSPSDLFPRDVPSQSVVLQKVMLMYEELPSRFKECRNAVGEMSEDIYGFQAANIIATIQLVRMVLFTAEESTVDQKCTIASELLDGFSKVPVSFLRAISSPLLYHLAGIGSILGSAMVESPLSETDYRQVRSSLLGIADLLASLENTISQNVGANARLRSLIARIDKFMISQRRQEVLVFSPAVVNHHSPNQGNSHQNLPMDLNNVMNHVEIGPWNDSSNDSPFGMVASNGMHESYSDFGVNQNELQFQIPPELLEDWPWPFDMTQGLGGFGNDSYRI